MFDYIKHFNTASWTPSRYRKLYIIMLWTVSFYRLLSERVMTKVPWKMRKVLIHPNNFLLRYAPLSVVLYVCVCEGVWCVCWGPDQYQVYNGWRLENWSVQLFWKTTLISTSFHHGKYSVLITCWPFWQWFWMWCKRYGGPAGGSTPKF